MKSYAIVDSSQKPILTVTFTGEKSTDENFQQYLDELENCYDASEILAIIFDASHSVIPNMAIRAVLKMIFSFQNQPAPYKIFSNIEEAENWIGDLISKTKALN